MTDWLPRQPAGAGHGFPALAKCLRCGTTRPVTAMVPPTTPAPGELVCADTRWCSEQTGVGLGKLDASGWGNWT